MKEKQPPAKSWISFRVKPTEYAIIHGHFSKTTCRKLSEYARNVLLQKPVVIKIRNKSADELLTAMIQLKKELNAIGNNFNQAVHKLHLLDKIPEFRVWVQQYDGLQKILIIKVEEIKLRMNQLYEQWLQK